MPSLWCLPTRFVRGPSAAAAIALINAVGSTGGFFGPSLVGLFRKYGGDTGAFYALAALCLAGCVWFIALRRIKSFQREPVDTRVTYVDEYGANGDPEEAVPISRS
jgi:ACS family tartrate transporter-like MFS transporter